MGPWTNEDIETARAVPFDVLLHSMGAYCKLDRAYRPAASYGSVRVHVNHAGRDFRFVFYGAKWVNELASPADKRRGGAGAIDLVTYITGYDFVRAVKVCLDADTSCHRGLR